MWNGLKLVSKLWSTFSKEEPALAALTSSDSQSEPQPSYAPGDLGLLLIAGISFATSLTLWAWSLTQTSVANSTLLNNMMPIFTTLSAWLLLGQQFKAKFLLGMAVAIVGVIAIGVED